MKDFLKFLANDLAGKGKYIKSSPNSLFTGLDIASNGQDLLTLFVTKISDKVAKEINFIRNTVKPMYADVLKYIDENASKFSKPTLADKMSIVEFNGSSFIEEAKKAATVRSPRKPSITAPGLEIKATLPEEPGEISRLFTYDDSALQVLAEPALKRLGAKGIESIYTNLTNGDYFQTPNSFLSRLVNDPLNNLDSITAAFILAINLQKNPKPVYIIAEETPYKKLMTWLAEELSNIVAVANKEIADLKSSKIVVLGVQNNTVSVSKPNYEKYLETGGTPESVLGYALLSDEQRPRSSSYLEPLMAKKLENEARWNKLVELEKLEQSQVDIARYRAMYSAACAYALQNIIPAKVLEQSGVTSAQIADQFMEYVNGLPTIKLVEKERVIAKFVGDFIFRDPSFAIITRSMIAYGKLTDLPPENTIKYAALEYIMDYLLDQFTVENAEFKLKA